MALVVSEKKIFLCISHYKTKADDEAPGTEPGPHGFKDFFCLFHCKSMEANNPRGGAISDPRGMLGRIYVKLHITLCCIPNIEALAVVVSEKKIFSCVFHYKPMADNDAYGVGPVWTPGAWLAGFIKRTTKHCYTKYESSGPCGFREEDFFFYVFSHCKSMGRSHF